MERILHLPYTLQASDVDFAERWRPGAIFVNMQEAGTHHAEHLGFGRAMTLQNNLVFVLARSRLEMQAYPHLNDEIISSTWPGKPNRFFCPRYHTFTRKDGTPLGSASTLWVLIDVNTRTVVSPLKANLPFPDTSDLPPPCPSPDKATMDEQAPCLTRMYSPVYTDIDLNRHVNNTRYVDWLCDSLGVACFENASIGTLLINYEKEIRSPSPLALDLQRKDDAFAFHVHGEDTSYCTINGTLARF